jgi:hypothetical protein
MPLRIAALDRLLLRRAASPAAADGPAPGSPCAAAAVAAAASASLHPHPHHPHPHRRSPHAHARTAAPHARPRKPRRPPPPGFGPRDDARSFFWGTVGFGALAYVAGAAPWALHLVFLAFFFLVLPLRAVSFWRRRWQFFLIDYCYFAAAAAAAFLLLAPDDARAEAAAYALTEGPLAAALAAWQCRLQFGSLEHTVSTHLHLLPGLAVVAHRYAAPTGVRGWRAIAGHLRATAREAGGVALELAAARRRGGGGGGGGGDGGTGGGGDGSPPRLLPRQQQQQQQRLWSPWTGTVTANGDGDDNPLLFFRLFRPPDGPLPPSPAPVPRPVLLWLVGAPVAFYCAWQLAYFVIVQLLCRDFILRERYDTSYTCLARRAQKNDNVWNRIVRRGGALRRCAAYGALQLGFTVASVVGVAAPAYLLGPRAGCLMQLVKVAVPLWYGARWQCEFGAPKRAFDAGARWQRQQEEREREGERGGAEGDGARAAGGGGGGSTLERVLSDGVLMAAGLGSGDGARDAIAGAAAGADEDDEATSGPLRVGSRRLRAAAAFAPLPEEAGVEEARGARAWGGGPISRLLRRRPRQGNGA